MIEKVPVYPVGKWIWILKNVSKGTIYEQRRGIVPLETNVVYQSGSTCFVEVDKSDKTKTLKILYRIGLKRKEWSIWDITKESAIDMIEIFPTLYEEVEEHNRTNRAPRGPEGGD